MTRQILGNTTVIRMMTFRGLPTATTAAVVAFGSVLLPAIAPEAEEITWSALFGSAARTAAIVFVTIVLVDKLRARKNRPAHAHPDAERPIVSLQIPHNATAGHQQLPELRLDQCQRDPGTATWAEIVGDEAAEIAVLADHVYATKSLAGYETELDDAFVRIDDLRWLLANYVLKGGRIRRLTSLPRLLASGNHDQHGSELYCTATELLHAIRNTNTDVADWLLAHRVALPNPDLLDTNTLLDRHLSMSLDPMTISADPLYQLTCHIHDVLEVGESLSDLEHPLIEVLESGLVQPLNAIDRELKATMAFNTAVLSTARSQAA